MRVLGCLVLAALSTSVQAQMLNFKSGHVKARYLLNAYPNDSLLKDYAGSPAQDVNGDLRLLVNGYNNNWDWQADYQFVARSGDDLKLSQQIQDNYLVPRAVQNDEFRLMDLTHIIHESDDSVVLQRLDRLSVGYTADKFVVRAGRQALSWGNGIIYNPVDFFNPFDPAAVDKEYKTGDDMLYGQYLTNSGNDWQAVSVWRRNEHGNTSSKVNTNALKYHAFISEREFDVLVAKHFNDDIFSAGAITSWGGAILRGDYVLTHTDYDTYSSAVANITYSWNTLGKNMSGVLEYFYNGMGVHERDYDDLFNNPDLVVRLARGELFTIGKQYLAGGITVEMTPLISTTPNGFLNLEDGSGLVQLVGQYDFEQNWQLLLAANIPFGSKGTEYGGLETGIENKYFSVDASLFAQLAFYF